MGGGGGGGCALCLNFMNATQGNPKIWWSNFCLMSQRGPRWLGLLVQARAGELETVTLSGQTVTWCHKDGVKVVSGDSTSCDKRTGNNNAVWPDCDLVSKRWGQSGQWEWCKLWQKMETNHCVWPNCNLVSQRWGQSGNGASYGKRWRQTTESGQTATWCHKDVVWNWCKLWWGNW